MSNIRKNDEELRKVFVLSDNKLLVLGELFDPLYVVWQMNGMRGLCRDD